MHRDPRAPRTAPPQRQRRQARRLVLGGLAVAMIAGCDSVSGIPGDEPEHPAAQVTTSTATAPSSAAPAPPPAPQASPVPADAPPVGEVPGVPEAAPALRRWAAGLTTQPIEELQSSCWTLAPAHVAEMYADAAPVLAALARPGTATATAVSWQGPAVTVRAELRDIASGYACPRVFATGTTPEYDDADARHVVRRYLARFVGQPLDPADTEGEHPLVCAATPATWDPRGTGTPLPAPLAGKPGALTGITAFDDTELTSAWLGAGYITVRAPVTSATGAAQTRTFTLTDGSASATGEAAAQGYCIGDVTP
ncbi:hypothetical protein AB0H71_08175 [Nocardia sp. NPDC050697]|uniref:hypothetical protein n=1 Tax=Nocardia sp. NPDC050697 TaxID=3155158 RepID=UPI003402AE98